MNYHSIKTTILPKKTQKLLSKYNIPGRAVGECCCPWPRWGRMRSWGGPGTCRTGNSATPKSASCKVRGLAEEVKGSLHIWCPHQRGEGSRKSRHSKGSCVNLVLEISPKCGQGGSGLKIPKKIGDILHVWSQIWIWSSDSEITCRRRE